MIFDVRPFHKLVLVGIKHNLKYVCCCLDSISSLPFKPCLSHDNDKKKKTKIWLNSSLVRLFGMSFFIIIIITIIYNHTARISGENYDKIYKKNLLQ